MSLNVRLLQRGLDWMELLSCGVSQGSVLDPLVFSLYLLTLVHVIHHCYTIDSQFYVSFSSDICGPLGSLHCWMASKVLLTNTQTEVLVTGPDFQPCHPPLTWNTKSNNYSPKTQMNNLALISSTETIYWPERCSSCRPQLLQRLLTNARLQSRLNHTGPRPLQNSI